MATGLVVDVGARLAAAADERTREWWSRYLKGAVPFRGVPMAKIRRTIHDAWQANGIADRPRDERIDLALRLLAEPYAEDKIAGVLALGELLVKELRLGDVPRLAEPFERGHIDDWSTCDWYCVKVLGRFVEHAEDRRRAAEAIAAWRHAEPFWQRRAAAASFVNLASRGEAFYPGFPALLLDVSAVNVRDPARFSQTGVAWLLRELSKAEPERVAAFVERHLELMSREAVKRATFWLREAAQA